MWVGCLRVVGLVALGLAVLGAGVAQADDEPLRRVDRMWLVGAPVLEADPARGLYVWIEDGAVQLAAWPKNSKQRTFRVRAQCTRAMTLTGLGDFKVVSKSSDSNVLLQVSVRAVPARGNFSCDGDVTISDATRGARASKVFVGPAAKKASNSVVIGRF